MFIKKFWITVCCSILLAGSITLGLDSAQATTIENGYNEQEDQYLEGLDFPIDGDYYKILIAIEQLPSELEEQGAEKIAHWISEASGVEVLAEGDYLVFPTLQNEESELLNDSDMPSVVTFASWTDYASCIGAIGLAAAANALPITKITKLKKIFSSLGGVTNSIKMIYTNYKYYRSKKFTIKNSLDKAITDIVNKNKLGSEAKQILLDFFGISSVIGSCGDLFSYELKEDKIEYLGTKKFA